MMEYRFYTADVFTDRIFGGNQLAVITDARGLDEEHMRAIAREFSLSETVFMFPPRDPSHTRHLRIFTPDMELPFAGHPTIGAAHILAASGALALETPVTRIVFEEGVGPVQVAIRIQDGQPVFAQLSAAKLPEFGPPPPAREELAQLLSIPVTDLPGEEGEVQAVSCGVPFVFIPVRNRAILGQVRIDRQQWEKSFASFWAPHIYVFTHDVELSGSAIRGRMFAPAMGIDEDPATGAAATALAGYLGVRDERQSGLLRWVIEQGFEMGRPSILEVEADKVDGRITAIRVGGSSVIVSEGVMRVPIDGPGVAGDR